MNPHYQELTHYFKEVIHLKNISSLLNWDQSTYMPEEGETARGEQMAYIGKLMHEKLSHSRVGDLLSKSESHCKSLGADSREFAFWRIAKRDYDRATKVKGDFSERLANHQAQTYSIWAKARAENNFEKVKPYLEKMLDLSREYSSFFAGVEHVNDPLIDISDPGVTTKEVRALFASLRKELVPLLNAILTKPMADDSCLRKMFPEKDQIEFGVKVITDLGYEWKRGRQDKTHHPFMTKFSTGDVRITTRVKENFLGECLFSTIHEAGHALYELGIDRTLEGTPLADGTSSGVHESQSRLWENLISKSLGFWKHYYPKLQKTFPEQLGSTPLETFYKAINKVTPSLIRTDADEVTYNLHVMIRFDLEASMLEGSLKIKDLPDAWNERYKQDLNITPPNNAMGCMQDVHWYAGTIGGMFQGYTIGNILSAQFFEAATLKHPSIPKEIEQGQFGTLRNWLKQELHHYGSCYQANEVILKSTGKPMAIAPYMNYLKRKYGELYGLTLS